jgi:hypothetical protein
MDEQVDTVRVRRHRSRAECEQIVVEFEASGLSRSEFCRQRGLSLSTLARYQRRQTQPGAPAWLAVELKSDANPSGLAVVLAGGRRIEIARGFDAPTLLQLLGLLERR